VQRFLRRVDHLLTNPFFPFSYQQISLGTGTSDEMQNARVYDFYFLLCGA
jgi:hypothetical protein